MNAVSVTYDQRSGAPLELNGGQGGRESFFVSCNKTSF